MRRLIIYLSKTGFSMQYAKWLGEDLVIPVVEYRESKSMDLNEYDEIILVNGIVAGNIPLFNDVIKRYLNKIVILAVGASDNTNGYYKKKLIENTKIADPLFYVRGGICYERLGFFTRFLLKRITKTSESFSFIDKSNLEEIEKYLINEENC